MKPIRSLIPIILIASAVAANPAHAQTRIVSYADLDLTSPAGQATLDRRLNTAIRQVCGRSYPLDLAQRSRQPPDAALAADAADLDRVRDRRHLARS